MDLASFVGLVVQIKSHQQTLVGTISQINPNAETPSITLTHVLINDRFVNEKIIFGKDITDLSVIESGPAQQLLESRPKSPKRMSPTINKSPENHNRKGKKKALNKIDNNTFDVDIQDESFEEDFNFTESLEKFDKKAGILTKLTQKTVFAEIKKLDSTAPEDLLVYHNLRDVNKQQKIPFNVNVLDDDKRYSNPSLPKDSSTYFETNSGKVIKAISSKSIAAIENQLASMGPYEEILMENGGRSAAMLVLQALDLAKKNTEQFKKNITVLCGNNKAGAYGFATARHLMNHGCNVTVATPYQDLEQDYVSTQRTLFSHCGGRVKLIREIPNPDLVVDSLMGFTEISSTAASNYDVHFSSLIRWTNTLQSVPILSINLASRYGDLQVNSKWVVSMGLLSTQHATQKCTLFICDVGIPCQFLQRVSAFGGEYVSPFSDKYLERVRKKEDFSG